MAILNHGVSPQKIVFTTAPFLDSYRVLETLEILSAQRVLAIGTPGDCLMGWTDIVGGSSRTGEGTLGNALESCLADLRTQARPLGANAVIAVTIQCGELSGKGKQMLYVMASGTAVQVEKIATESVAGELAQLKAE